jgi:hypothetical protein
MFHLHTDACPIPLPLHHGRMWPMYISPFAPRLLDPNVQETPDVRWATEHGNNPNTENTNPAC